MKTAGIRAVAVLIALTAAGAASAQTGMTREQVQRRYQVRLMEGVLVGAARHGAELLGMRVQQIDPSIVLLSGNSPRAQGLVIEGHGIVFYVEVPNINPTMVWAMRNRVREQQAQTAILNIKRRLETVTSEPERAELQAELRRIERLVPPGTGSTQAPPRQGVVAASGMEAPPATFAPAPVMEDPEAEYERLVTEQLISAMLDYSHQLGLGADEWLTIAARGSQGPLETVFDPLVTITLRIKGGDLAEYRAGRLTRDEARARVVIREF
jgi:hypothetical protein